MRTLKKSGIHNISKKKIITIKNLFQTRFQLKQNNKYSLFVSVYI